MKMFDDISSLEQVIRRLYSDRIMSNKDCHIVMIDSYCYDNSGWTSRVRKYGNSYKARFEIGVTYKGSVHISWYDEMFITVDGNVNLNMKMFNQCFRSDVLAQWREEKLNMLLC